MIHVIPAVEGIGGSEDRRPGIERGRDSCFGDGDGLLLHDFVDGRAIVFVHFVKLIDAAHSHIGQDKRTRLQTHILTHGIDLYCCGEAHIRAALPCCVDTSWSDVGDVF